MGDSLPPPWAIVKIKGFCTSRGAGSLQEHVTSPCCSEGPWCRDCTGSCLAPRCPEGRSHQPWPVQKRALVTRSGSRAGGRRESPQGPAAGTSSLHTRPPPGCSLPPRTSRLKLEPELFLCACVRACVRLDRARRSSGSAERRR